MLRHSASSLRMPPRHHRDSFGPPIRAGLPRSSPKVSPSSQRQRVRVKWWLASLWQFPVFEEGLEKLRLPGYQNRGQQRLYWHRYRETRWHVAVAFRVSLSADAAMPDAPTWTDDLSPEQRVRNLAAILAAGVRRYRKLARRSDSGGPNKTAESGGTCLEALRETRLSVSRFQG